jgi:hypothetical protein
VCLILDKLIDNLLFPAAFQAYQYVFVCISEPRASSTETMKNRQIIMPCTVPACNDTSPVQHSAEVAFHTDVLFEQCRYHAPDIRLLAISVAMDDIKQQAHTRIHLHRLQFAQHPLYRRMYMEESAIRR